MTDSTTLAKPPNAISVTGFFADEGFDFLTRCAIGYAAQGVMDVGQVFATIACITDGDADSWYAAWRQTAGNLHAKATAALVSGHTATAHRLFLAAAEAYSQTGAVADRQKRPDPVRARVRPADPVLGGLHRLLRGPDPAHRRAL
jgi:hypothetical protein